MLRYIKKLIPEKWKIAFKLLFVTTKDSRYLRPENMHKKVVYLFLAGFYQNLGDMAITYAQKEFLKQLFPNSEIVTIASSETYSAIKTIRRSIKPSDLITIVGGGNMDDLYVSLEEARLYVVKSFPQNRIISFPQTISFSNTSYGNKRRQISRCVYEKHKKLTIFAREYNSFISAKKLFPHVSVELCPDIVFFLNKVEPHTERNGVLCCLRSDKEQNTGDLREQLLEAIHHQYENVQITDTIDIPIDDCKAETYEATLERFWVMLRGKHVVLTDRLHCMIFCVITGTPCVVLDNSNHKISGVYKQWLQGIGYVSLIETMDIEVIIDEMKRLEAIDSTNLYYDVTELFAPLRTACKVDE